MRIIVKMFKRSGLIKYLTITLIFSDVKCLIIIQDEAKKVLKTK